MGEPTTRWKEAAWVGAWLAAVGVAALLDTRVVAWAERFSENVTPVRDSWYANLAKVPGEFRFTILFALVMVVLHPWKWRAAGLVALSTAVGGAVYSVLKWTVGRHRPKQHEPFVWNPFIGGIRGLIHSEPNLSFPSGHVTCAFATAAAGAVLFPKWRVVFYAVATVVAVERVMEAAHYLSDVVAAIGIGILCVRVSVDLGAWMTGVKENSLASEPSPGQSGQSHE